MRMGEHLYVSHIYTDKSELTLAIFSALGYGEYPYPVSEEVILPSPAEGAGLTSLSDSFHNHLVAR